jgi:hypothetical protein
MPTRKLYAVDTSTGERYELLTLHPDGSLTAEADDMAEALPVLRGNGLSNEFIFEYMKRKSNAYVQHVEEIVDE